VRSSISRFLADLKNPYFDMNNPNMKEDLSSDAHDITDDNKELTLTLTVGSRNRNPLDNHLVRPYNIILFSCLRLIIQAISPKRY